MARIGSGTIVAGLTAAALAVIAALAVQASGSAPVTTDTGSGKTGPSASSGATTSPSTPQAAALPPASGSGKRVVYSLAAERVWLVDATEKVLRTYAVAPGSVNPPLGSYTVTVNSRTAGGMGGDGVPIEHVVRFTSVGAVVIGFSAAVDGSLPTAADPQTKTGGIREKRADGTALWKHAGVGTAVVVVA